MNKEKIIEIFELGVDFGLLMAEEERQKEGIFEAMQGSAFSDKFSMPMPPQEKRQIHSKKWFDAKNKSIEKFSLILQQI